MMFLRRAKPVHRAALIRSDGSVSAKCFARPRRINLRVATWTLRDQDVTCEACKRLLGNAPKVVRP